MKATKMNVSVSVLALAVQAALLTLAFAPMAAQAEDNPDVKVLTQPTNYVEIGVNDVSNGSDKFGEYNGLNKAGATAIGNLSIKGGDGYGEGTTRYSVYGKDLGTTSREFGFDVANQGVWNFGLHADQLTHYITDSFQTPFQGAMGGNAFTLPSNFGFINANTPYNKVGTGGQTLLTAPPTTSYGTQALSPTQQADFHNENIYSGRTNTGLTMGVIVAKGWSLQFDYNRLVQDGAKLISAGSDGFGTMGAVGAGIVVPTYGGSYYAKGEAPVMLANPTNYVTDSMELSTNWISGPAHLTASVYASIFHDANSEVSWTSPYVGTSGLAGNAGNPGPNGSFAGSAYPINALSTAPSNTFVQGNLSGGYAFTPTTKLTGGLSYGRNVQNEQYVNVPGTVDNLTYGLPQNSLEGLVVTTHADVKLVNQTTKDLTLAASFKYNERDNRTAANAYSWFSLDGAGVGTGGVQTPPPGNPFDTAVNTPLSNRKTNLDLSADYKISHGQSIRFAYDYEKVERWCDAALANNAGVIYGSAPAGTTVAGYYGTTTSCVQVPQSTENKLGANYKYKPSDDLSINAGYSYANRNADLLTGFYTPMAAQQDGEGYENLGYIAFFDASRKEQLFKAGANWQASDKFNVSLSGKYTKDDYNESTFGVQNGSSWSVNLDSVYQVSEKGSFSAYATAQRKERELYSENGRHATSIATTTFQTQFADKDFTIGVGYRQAGLMNDKLSLAADLLYSDSTTGWNSSLPGGSTAVCAVPGVQPNGSYTTSGYNCGATPDITSKVAMFKFSGAYAYSAQSQVRFGVQFQHLNADDYIYNAYQMGYSPTSVMPSNQSSPTYNVTSVYVAYRYSFASL